MRPKESQSVVDLRDSQTVITRIRGSQALFVTVAGLTFLVLACGLALLPRKFQSEAKLLVNSERPDLVISAADTKNDTSREELAETRLYSEIEVLKSRDLLAMVVRSAGLVSKVSGNDNASEEQAINRLQAHLVIEPIKKSSVLQLTYLDKSGAKANYVLNQLVRAYLDFHLKVHAAPGSVTFFTDQTNAYAQRLASSERQLREFRQLHPDVAGSSTELPLQERAAQAKALLENANAEEAEYAKQVQAGNSVLRKLSPRVTSQMRVSPQVGLLAQLTGTLVSLQNRRTEAMTKFLPTDRFITELDKEISDTQSAIDRVNQESSTEVVSDLNQVRTDAEKALVEARVRLAGVSAKRDELQGQLSSYKIQSAEDAGAAIDDGALARAVKEDEENYLLYARKREEAAISASLDQQRITDVSVIESPTYSSKPVSPQVATDAAAAFLFSCLAAYLVLLAVDIRTRTASAFQKKTTSQVGVTS